MDSFGDYDSHFRDFVENMGTYAPDGILSIDLAVLQNLGMLSTKKLDLKSSPSLTRFFRVSESTDRVTLFNDQCIAWIVPQMVSGIPITFTLLATIEQGTPNLELVFSTSGIYNHSPLILKILDCFLSQIQENDDFLRELGKDEE